MPESNQHPTEALQDLLDERIDSRMRATVQAHLEGCETCRNELDRLRWLKNSVLGKISEEQAPESLRAGILAALDTEDAATPAASWFTRLGRPLIYGLSTAAVVVLLIGYVLRVPAQELPLHVARDYTEFKSESLQLQMLTTKTEELESFFAQNGIVFETRVFDLGMMNFQLVGGRVHKLGDEPSALFVYQGPNGVILLCQMFEGTLGDLPKPDEIREHDAIRFQIYRRGDFTLAFWQEGSVICVLISDAGAEQLIQLAFAKAMKV